MKRPIPRWRAYLLRCGFGHGPSFSTDRRLRRGMAPYIRERLRAESPEWTLTLRIDRPTYDILAWLQVETRSDVSHTFWAGLGLLKMALENRRRGGRLVMVDADGTETEITGFWGDQPAPGPREDEAEEESADADRA